MKVKKPLVKSVAQVTKDVNKKYVNDLSKINPNTGDMQVANKALHDNLLKDLKNQKITTADKIPIPPPKKKDFHIDENLKIVKDAWIDQIEEFCNKEGILPQDLIHFYKESKKAKKKDAKPERIRDFTSDKTSKVYNPNDNPLWKSKMGIK